MVTNTIDTNNQVQTEVVKLCLTKVKLNIPLISTFYNQGLNDSQIAKRCGISQQAVSAYKIKHLEEILPLIIDKNMYNAIDSLYIAQQAKSKLKDILDTCNDFDKKDIIPLTAMADRFTTQERLYSGESTGNIAIKSSRSDLKELDSQIATLEAKILDM